MIKVKKIIDIIEKFAPLELAEKWDNSGWQVNLGKQSAKNIMLCLSLTQDVIKQAQENGCDFIISHHPLFFSEFKNISTNNISQKILIEAIKNEIQIYSAHTNLDKTKGGVNDILIRILGIKKAKTVDEYVRLGAFSKKIGLENFIAKLKLALNAEKIKLINPNNIQEIKTIAVCSGSGAEFIDKTDADVFITGDIKYHTALDIQDKVVIDAGHFETERIILPVIKELLKKEAPYTIIAHENNPFIIT